MRKIVLGLGVAATAISAPAMARDGEGYFGAEAGLVFPEDFDTDVNGLDDAGETNTDRGWEGAAFVGYDCCLLYTSPSPRD